MHDDEFGLDPNRDPDQFADYLRVRQRLAAAGLPALTDEEANWLREFDAARAARLRELDAARAARRTRTAAGELPRGKA